MTFKYYWDRELFEALLRYRMRPYLNDVVKASSSRRRPMGSPADIQKLLDGMKRAKALTERAAQDAPKQSAIMDAFEQRMNLNNENMAKIAEYEKLMAEMDQGNGGPALATTFSSDAAQPAAQPATPAVAPLIHRDTGDPVR